MALPVSSNDDGVLMVNGNFGLGNNGVGVGGDGFPGVLVNTPLPSTVITP